MTDAEKIEAIRALLHGDWDNEQLMKVDYLIAGADYLRDNIRSILNS